MVTIDTESLARIRRIIREEERCSRPCPDVLREMRLFRDKVARGGKLTEEDRDLLDAVD